MNWGKGITLFMAAFITFILVLVFRLISADVDLESDDYYAREINYEKEMEAVQNAEDLENKIEIASTDGFVALKIPDDKNFEKIELKLIRVNNEKLDRVYSIRDTKTFLIDKNELVKGHYRTELYYTISSKKYLQKEDLYL